MHYFGFSCNLQFLSAAFPLRCAWRCADNCRCNNWERWGKFTSVVPLFSIWEWNFWVFKCNNAILNTFPDDLPSQNLDIIYVCVFPDLGTLCSWLLITEFGHRLVLPLLQPLRKWSTCIMLDFLISNFCLIKVFGAPKACAILGWLKILLYLMFDYAYGQSLYESWEGCGLIAVLFCLLLQRSLLVLPLYFVLSAFVHDQMNTLAAIGSFPRVLLCLPSSILCIISYVLPLCF